MTRDECLIAVSNAFNGVRAEAAVGFWNVRVSTMPAREVIFSSRFLDENVFGGRMTPAELTDYIKAIPDIRWSTQPDGLMMLSL
jgi:hypothetical protein